ncbi:MAG: hypothetical protein U1E42_07665 [Rhodospirillales bacterium]
MGHVCESRRRGTSERQRARLMMSVAMVGGLGLAAMASGTTDAAAPEDVLTFKMVRSTASVGAGCLAGAWADVRIEELENVERMTVVAHNLPPDTEFDLFVIQLAEAPFGLSWYQGDMESNGAGVARATFLGRFNIETFIVAPGTGPAPVVHRNPIPDADQNPATGPVHTFHLGLWFNSPEDAAAAGCLGAVTPFNGEHNAGVQALSTRQFPPAQGPLRRLR